MKRRNLLLAICLLPTITLAGTEPRAVCPICSGTLVHAGDVHYDPSQPSPNLTLWNGSQHGDFWPFHSQDSPYCVRCHVTYRPQLWERSSELPDSFHIALRPSIRNFPLPDARLRDFRTVYEQQFGGADASQGRIESVSYWARDSDKLRGRLQDYADAHALNLLLERERRRSLWVLATTKLMPYTHLAEN